MNPYKKLPQKAFWKLSVGNKSMYDISDLWEPKYKISPKHNVVTFGSCFAQHIGKALASRGFNWLSTELPPSSLSSENSKQFNYNVFSARTGNIYTTTLLKQWTEWALDLNELPEEVWEKDGRFFDPFRPVVEPNGFASREEARQSLRQTVSSFKASIEKATFFVFTLGLTESWHNNETGFEYPMCPGTVAGEFDKSKHKFVNQDFQTVKTALNQSMSMMRSVNPNLKFILTVSPVPLTATNSGKHVLVATTASKSILRGVADQLCTNRAYVDYFPSYEIITCPAFKGSFFEPNQRSVNPFGVNFVMNSFFDCLAKKFGKQAVDTHKYETDEGDVICEEELLEVFGK